MAEGTAPYTFIPFQETILDHGGLWDAADLALHARLDEVVPGTHTGFIDLALRTLTPLYVGMERPEDQNPGGTATDQRIPSRSLHVQTDGNWHALIPGSSIRGCIRSLLAGVLGEDVRPDQDTTIMWRAPLATRGDSVAEAQRRLYWKARIGDGNQPSQPQERAGMLELSGGSHTVTECPDAVQVSWELLQKSGIARFWAGSKARDPAAFSALQFQPVIYTSSSNSSRRRDMVDTIRLKAGATTRGTERDGYLLLTGLNSPGTGRYDQKHAYVIPAPHTDAKILPLHPDALTEFLDDSTPYRKKFLPDIRTYLAGGKPVPVFYDSGTAEAGREVTVLALGLSGGFRITANNTLQDTLPGFASGPAVSALDVLFGRVLTRDLKGADDQIASRISFGHAWCELGKDLGAHFESPEPLALMAPKVEAFHTRLEQSGAGLTTYQSATASYRGREMYLHRWDQASSWKGVCATHRALMPGADGHDRQVSAEATREYSPLKSGLDFHARIRFHNLTEAELGALLWALQLGNPPDTDDATTEPPLHAHKIGGIRPLGLGSVHIRPVLHLLNPANRYSAGAWAVATTGYEPQTPDQKADVIRVFLNQAHGGKKIKDTAQAKYSLWATRWKDRLPVEQTAEMKVAAHQQRLIPKPIDRLWTT